MYIYWVMEPGLVLKKIMIDFGGLKPSYAGPGETKWRDKQ